MPAMLLNPAQPEFKTGMIMMWHGTIATIPTGWALCNGASGTPNLADKFIVCASIDDGGVAKTQFYNGMSQSGGAGTHTHATTAATDTGYASVSDAGHTHTIGAGGSISAGGNYSSTTDYGNASLSDMGHTHYATGDTDNPSGAAVPYYALAFIMKL